MLHPTFAQILHQWKREQAERTRLALKALVEREIQKQAAITKART